MSRVFKRQLGPCRDRSEDLPENVKNIFCSSFSMHELNMAQNGFEKSQAIKDALDSKQVLTAIAVDLKSAYDMVWKENLLFKLNNRGISGHLLSWIKSFLSQRLCRVRSNLSKFGLLQTGLPQGAVQSCILFNAYINDLVQKLKSIHGVKCLLYADDLLIWTVTPKKNLVPLTEKLLNQAFTNPGKVVRREQHENGDALGQPSTPRIKTFVLPVITFCCEPLISASKQVRKSLETFHNQALRLITGAVKTSPIDAMLLCTRNWPLEKIIEEKALVLWEKS
ncbi:reverse transcriptase domain-containing protein [Caerostris extrusa]|uniref:Reverse transcriptase domain-containing protein n=1 Tax=Caerostris extrusa TaxID=172846 RepID=A0AAV4QIP1_CAEEX|nr:reverse transcriptase domain-containing protein [Caerostris extrusa]